MIFDELDSAYSLMNEQHDVSEELMGIVLAPTDDATGMMGMAPCDGRCGNMPRAFFMPRRLFETWR